MIYTVTANPALDRAIAVERLVADDTCRALSDKAYAAGKGINVARVIVEIGGQCVALGFVGGYDGLQLEGLLINAGVTTHFTRIAGETRTNIILKEKATDRQYVIGAAGPEVSATEIGQFYQSILQIQNMAYLVISGSLPPGVTSSLYGQIIMAGRRKGAFVLLDADGKALKQSIEYVPTCIKPNTYELCRLVDRELKTEEDIFVACDEIHRKGISNILVSRGKDGLILSTENQKIKAAAPPIESESAVGAGDSAVAGFLLAHSQNKTLSECVALACAAGTATAQTPGTELCHRHDVERILPLVRVMKL
jgi:6-phosphofructokinase 2